MLTSKKNKIDLVIIGGGTSGLMCALGAIKYGLKVIVIGNNNNFAKSSLLAEVIPTTALSYIANLVKQINNANNFGLDVVCKPVDITKINHYIQRVIKELQQENDWLEFENLGGSLIIGDAKFVDSNSVMVGDKTITSKYFVIATGSQEPISNILDFDKSGYLKYRDLFTSNNNNFFNKKIIIIASKPEALIIAQSLARLGSKIILLWCKSQLLSLEDPEIITQLQNTLEQEGVIFYLSVQVLKFNLGNNSKLLTCQNIEGSEFIIEGDEIIDMRESIPNVEDLSLQNTKILVNSNGISVNNKLQTAEKNIFAIGSVIKSPFKSVHLVEQQINVILNNIIFKTSRTINYKLTPRILLTMPQLASIGVTNIAFMDSKHIQNKKIKVLYFNLNNIDAAIVKNNNNGVIKIVCQRDYIIGVSILGPIASELIAEYSLAMQLGASITEIAANIHPYPTLSQINKKAAYTVFNQETNKNKQISPSLVTVMTEKTRHKMQQIASLLSLASV